MSINLRSTVTSTFVAGFSLWICSVSLKHEHNQKIILVIVIVRFVAQQLPIII